MRLRGALRDPDQSRYFLVLVPLDVMQHEDGARAGWQARDGPFEIDRVTRRGLSARDRTRLELGVEFDSLGEARPGPAIGENHVHRESMKPGGEGAFTSKGRQSFPCANEDILGEVFGPGAFANEPQRQRKDPPDMGPVNPLEGAFIPGLSGPHIGVGRIEDGHIRGPLSHRINQRIGIEGHRTDRHME